MYRVLPGEETPPRVQTLYMGFFRGLWVVGVRRKSLEDPSREYKKSKSKREKQRETAERNRTAATAAAPHPPHQQRANNESNRVFKLQFDARRIVCCSQNKVIVGWDFANGDVDLERVGEWSLETA